MRQVKPYPATGHGQESVVFGGLLLNSLKWCCVEESFFSKLFCGLLLSCRADGP
jgi:hypothetical protein